ncbi:MAG TPA: pseudouridine synthase [Rectinemataceae bacterium]
MSETKRLQAYMASCGIGSRRACEKLIKSGKVRVNGQPALLGSSVGPEDAVVYEGKILRPETRLRYIILNKPRGFVSSMADEKGRPVAASLLGVGIPERVYNVGRLDQWSSGLLLFTNDGELARILVHPSGGIDKEYIVKSDKPLPRGLAESFERGLELGNETLRALEAELIGDTTLRVVLLEGKNREIRRVLEHYGLRTLSLRRVRLGPIHLGDLPEGAYRELDPQEVVALLEYSKRKEGEKGSTQ